jgi:hypothetical protein
MWNRIMWTKKFLIKKTTVNLSFLKCFRDRTVTVPSGYRHRTVGLPWPFRRATVTVPSGYRDRSVHKKIIPFLTALFRSFSFLTVLYRPLPLPFLTVTVTVSDRYRYRFWSLPLPFLTVTVTVSYRYRDY